MKVNGYNIHQLGILKVSKNNNVNNMIISSKNIHIASVELSDFLHIKYRNS